MARKLKVYRWLGMPFRGFDAPGHRSGRQVQVIVAAGSRSEALRAAGCSETEVRSAWARDYVGETRNEADMAVALAKPGAVFVAADQAKSEWVEVPKEAL